VYRDLGGMGGSFRTYVLYGSDSPTRAAQLLDRHFSPEL
jgi:hypothetical protein